MLSNIQSVVKGSKVLGKGVGGEATSRAANIYLANTKVFPSIAVQMLAEANSSIEKMGGYLGIDKASLEWKVFLDTIVIQCKLEAVKKSKLEGNVRWNIAPIHRALVSKVFPGISYSIKDAGALDGTKVVFKLTLHAQNMALGEAYAMVLALKHGDIFQDGVQFSLVDVDITCNIPVHIKAGFSEDYGGISIDGKLLKVQEYQKRVGLQCPQWNGSGLYFKVYNKLSFMLIKGESVNKVGGSQLNNIFHSPHKNISEAFRNPEVQENGFGRAELRFNANVLPESLEAAVGALFALTEQALVFCGVRQSLDKSVRKYLASGHRQLVYLEEQKDDKWKVVLVRWGCSISRNYNSQSISSSGINEAVGTKEEAQLLGYQWAIGGYPVVYVEANKDLVVEVEMLLPPTNRIADVEWDSRKGAETRNSTAVARGVSSKEVGMPSFWMEHPRKRLGVAMGDCTAWLAQGRSVQVSYDISSKAQSERTRLWVAKVTKDAKKQVADMVGKRCPVGAKFGGRMSLDAVKDSVLLVVATRELAGKHLFLASDGNAYEFSKRMRDAGQHKLVASRDNPLVFVRGSASKQKTALGYKQYPEATMEMFCRSSCEKWLPDLAAYFYSEADWVKYGDVLA